MNKKLNPKFADEPFRTFTAIVENRNTSDLNRFGYIRILLREVRLNGRLLFREHMWIKDSKHTKHLKKNTVIRFRGKIEKYIDIDNANGYKVTVACIRNIDTLYIQNTLKMRKEMYLPRRIYNRRLKKFKAYNDRNTNKKSK